MSFTSSGSNPNSDGKSQPDGRASRSLLPLQIGIMTVVLTTMVVASFLIYRMFYPPIPPVTRPPIFDQVKKREEFPVPEVRFTDITREAGIQFKHINGAFGKKLLPETMGSGVAFLDFNNDGRQDLLLISSTTWPGDPMGPVGSSLQLYRNNGDNKFTNVTREMGLEVDLYGMGVTVGDYDNDGWQDIMITAVGGNRLYRNREGKGFEDVTTQAGLAGPGMPRLNREEFLKQGEPITFPSSATFVDYDGDGKLDLFVCHYVTWSPRIDLGISSNVVGVGRAYVAPTQFEGTTCALYRNVDGKRFEDVSAHSGVQVFDREGQDAGARKRAVGKSLGVILCDPDEDGWPDLMVSNDTVRNFFFHNEPAADGSNRRVFREIGMTSNIAFVEGGARGGMGIDWGEFLPKRYSLMIANFANEPNSFLCQESPRKLSFSDQAYAVGLVGPSKPPLKFGAFFFDYDLDGRLDLLTCNGHLEPEISKIQEGQTYAQSAQLFWNTGRKAGCFEPVRKDQAGSAIFQEIVGRGSAFADIDGDGDPDVVLVGNNGPPLLLRNDNPLKHHWIRLKLVGDGVRSNKSAIGARVTVEAGSLIQHAQVTAARGYLSQSELPLTFGLGKINQIDKITIHWPGAKASEPTVISNPEVDKEHVVEQK